MTPKSLLRIAVVAGMLTAAGCGGSSFGEVEGTLTLDGKPLENIRITFSPEPSAGSHGPGAYATTDREGHYRLACLNPRRGGAVVGKHRVMFTDGQWATAPADGQRTPAGKKGPRKPVLRPSRIPSHYSPLSPTSLLVEVHEGKQTIDLRLTSRP